MKRATRGFVRIPIVCLGVFALSLVLARPGWAKFASLIVDAETGKVHHAVNADTRNFPASLAKMMTLYLLFEKLKNKELTLNTRFHVSRRAARQPASRLGLKPGQTISIAEVIPSLVIKSANDVASVVADALAGGERPFALHMTARARQLGMRRTTFRNASGLPHRGQMSTARDMATLAGALTRDFPQYYHYFAQRSFRFAGQTYRTHNNLLKNYDGTEGLKTGYIRVSGFNLVATVQRGGHRLIGVIFGGNTARARDRLMTRLLDKAFNTLREPLIASAPPPARKAKTQKNRAQPPSRKTSRPGIPIWGIQVGAYYSRAPAFDMAREVKRKHSQLLSDGRIFIKPLKRSRSRVIFRARIVGLARRHAFRACRLLKRARQPCMTLRVRDSFEVAAARPD
ncbi:MAG: D-alanyl-D-alanine carboxypeptidase family protein [Rhodospirillales bacterium]|jgi:D-alanyl-D-alanine carboxypeptidase|nr:D-alanyl-D-alanine carboxypeptidase family protein [Rhodospirillales bacterium]